MFIYFITASDWILNKKVFGYFEIGEKFPNSVVKVYMFILKRNSIVLRLTILCCVIYCVMA